MPKVFAVMDEKVETFGQPVVMETVGQAIRMFTDVVNDGQSMWCKHPTDFQLYQLGEFNDRSGEFVNDRKFVIAAIDVKQPEVDPAQLSFLDEKESVLHGEAE